MHARQQAGRQVQQGLAFERMARLQSVTAALSESLTPEQVAAVVVDQGIAALDGCAGSVALLDEAAGVLEVVAAVGYPAHLLSAWHSFPVTAPAPLAESVRTGTLVLLESEGERAAR